MFGEGETESVTYGKWELEIEPQLEYTIGEWKNSDIVIPPKTIVVDQNSKGYGELGSHIWDAGLVLARFLETDLVEVAGTTNKVPLCSGKRCIELGSGIGFTGTVAALLGADITLTDKPSLLQLIQHNVNKNVDDTAKVRIEALSWGANNPFGASFDLTYDLEDGPILHILLGFRHLIGCWVHLATTGDAGVGSSAGVLKTGAPGRSIIGVTPEVSIMYGKERYAMQFFFEQAAHHFDFEFVPEEYIRQDDVKHPISTIGIVKMRLKK